TAGGFFSLEPESNTVLYNYFFDFEPAAADPESFVETLENILQLVDVWADRINGQSDDNNDNDASAAIPNQPSTLFFRP
ncbi:MAG: type III secretion system chaperone, partial [Victivallales bacterium]|nr:type III secretion system chaperone [Victivallales bacterium]